MIFISHLRAEHFIARSSAPFCSNVAHRTAQGNGVKPGELARQPIKPHTLRPAETAGPGGPQPFSRLENPLTASRVSSK